MSMAVGLNHPMLSQIGEMFGNGDLIKAENRLEVADAKLPMGKEMQDTEAGLIAKAFIDLDQVRFHARWRIYP